MQAHGNPHPQQPQNIHPPGFPQAGVLTQPQMQIPQAQSRS
jgi:hypothetical protein